MHCDIKDMLAESVSMSVWLTDAQDALDPTLVSTGDDVHSFIFQSRQHGYGHRAPGVFKKDPISSL